MDIGLSDASNVLWRQRHLLELLLFKLDVEQTLLSSGRLRWLARATNEVELVLDELRTTELARAVAIDEVAREVGLGPGSTLRELAEAAPEPWDEILAEHRRAFLDLTEEVSVMAGLNRELVTAGQRAVADSLGSLLPSGDALLDGRLGTFGGRRASMLVDEIV